MRLAEHTGESASLAALDGTDAVYIARVPVGRIMSVNVALGTRVPAHTTSMGRVPLAWRPYEQVQEFIDTSGLPAWTPRTVTDPSIFHGALRTVRDQGWSLVAGELEPGLVSVSAPVAHEGFF